MEIKINNKDVIWSYFSQIFQFGAGLFLLPVILRKLPSEHLAIWYVFLSITSLVNLLDFGFQQTIMRNVSYIFSGAQKLLKFGIDDEASEEVNYELLLSLIKSAKKIYRTIAIIAFILLIIFGTWYIYDITTELAAQKDILIAWVIYVFSAVLNFYFYYYTPLLLGRGQIKESNKTIVFSKLFYIGFSFIGLSLNYGLIAVSIGNLLGSFVNRILSYNYFYDEDLKINLNCVSDFSNDKSIFNIIWANSYRFGLVSLGGFLILRSNTLLTSKFLDLKIVAQYGLSLQLLNILARSSKVLFNTFLPKFNQLRVKNKITKLKKYFGTSLLIGWGTYFLGVIIIYFLGNDILNLIGSETSLLSEFYLLFLSLILFLEFNHSIFATFITTQNEVPFVKASLFSGFGIVISSFIILKYTEYGILGILVAQFFIQLSYNNWKWPYKVLKDLESNYKELLIFGIQFIGKKIKDL
jgi:O-antigen/teichoic acid export membrane protein